MERGFEAVLSRPLWLVLIVALGLGLPVIAVGEVAANDARMRSGQAESAATSLATQRAATAIADRLKVVKSQVAVMTQSSPSGKAPPLVSALQAGDAVSLQAQLAGLRALIEPEMPPSAFEADFYILDPRNVTLAVDPFVRTSIGVDRSGRPYAGGATQAATVIVTPVFRSVVDPTLPRNPTNTLNAGVVGRMLEPGSLRPLGSLVVLVSARVIADSIQALRPAAEEVYVIDETGRLIVRATHNFSSDPATFMDLSAQPPIAAALRGPLAGTRFDDPFGAGSRLTTAAAVPDIGWHVVAVAQPSISGLELESTLTGQRLVRGLLVLVLLAGTYVLARSVRRTIRQRGELTSANVTIAQANEAKSRFLTNMSHELRTPLNAIIGFADVLGQKMFGELNPKQDEYLADIGTSGRHLLDLVNQILDLSKVEAGRMDLEPSTFSPAETIRASLAFVRERAAAHRIEIAAAVPTDLPSVTADERKIRQVLLNLLSNAVKFTPDGGSIGVTARTAGGDLEIAVKDSGIGIPPGDQPAVFEEFRQVGERSDRSREGTGLGLTLAKRFIELHGGRIWVESEVGKGTTFTFAIPVARTVAASA